ncbi:MAG: hypothetical protein ABI895_33685 [Deltaproteobacteria bacterium]
MPIVSTHNRLVVAGAALVAALAAPPGTADARALPGIMGRDNPAEINGVRFEDCIIAQQTGAVMNTCRHNQPYYMPLPIDAAGKKSVRIMVKAEGANVGCTLWATDETGGTLVLAQGSTTTVGLAQAITINSHPVPERGRLHLYCVLPYRSVIYTVNYTP